MISEFLFSYLRKKGGRIVKAIQTYFLWEGSTRDKIKQKS